MDIDARLGELFGFAKHWRESHSLAESITTDYYRNYRRRLRTNLSSTAIGGIQAGLGFTAEQLRTTVMESRPDGLVNLRPDGLPSQSKDWTRGRGTGSCVECLLERPGVPRLLALLGEATGRQFLSRALTDTWREEVIDPTSPMVRGASPGPVKDDTAKYTEFIITISAELKVAINQDLIGWLIRFEYLPDADAALPSTAAKELARFVHPGAGLAQELEDLNVAALREHTRNGETALGRLEEIVERTPRQVRCATSAHPLPLGSLITPID